MEKIRHKIITKCVGIELLDRVYRSLIRHTVTMVLKAEDVDMPCVVNVRITDDDGIRAYNKKHRKINKATDVLSYPMQFFSREGWRGLTQPDMDLDTQMLPLGDIVISTKTIRRNARRYRHTFEQETARMIVHSTLHLLGFDHGDNMLRRERAYMRDLGYFLN